MSLKRIDKIISEKSFFSRKEIKKMINKGIIHVNGDKISKPEEKYDESDIEITINGERVNVKEHIYLILNKPKGYVSSTKMENKKTVIDLVPEKYKSRNIFPAGRLDKDTTGFMIITDDGKFAHNILSPRKHVKKIYEVIIDIPITDEMIEGFKRGIELKEGKCKPAIIEVINRNKARITIMEGKYHQIKRMFAKYRANVTNLNRICIGNLEIPKELKLGDIREATEEELRKIQEI